MIDIKFLRENPDVVKQNIKNKFQNDKLPLVDEVIELDKQARAAQQEADTLRANKNAIAKQIGALMAQGNKEEAEEVKKQVTAASDHLAELEEKEKDLEERIKKIAHGEVPVFHAEGGAAAEDDSSTKDSFGRSLYKNLMNGVSHMLPFVVGGGIMIALAFLLDDYTIDPSNFGMNTPVAAFFKPVGGAAFGYMLPILSAFIAMSIADRPGLAVGFVGGVLAMNGTNFAGIATGETTGISGGFLAALLAGFAAGYIVQFLKKITEKLPASLNGIRPMLIYPLGGMLVIGAVMCGINPVMGMINTAMTNWLNAMGGTSKVLLGAIVAGMMSIDMGGPFNKAAYVFGTAALASGNYEVMAAVMVGGMVPPIAIALSTTFCPRKWTLDERRNGIVNYVMGLCFVSEGAIPYAAADPLRVLPSCVVGSAVAGALSMTFGCALRAPHGGIFVFPVVDHAALYCVALAVGSVLGAVILSLVKKSQPAEAK